MDQIPYAEFAKAYREKEALEGTKLEANANTIAPEPTISDEELQKLYQAYLKETYTGVTHHGDITEPGPVLTLKGTGK
jgi:hypothetical protein